MNNVLNGEHQFAKYERISDEAFKVSGYSIKFNVGLWRTGENTNKFFYSEYEYGSRIQNNAIQARINFDAYLSIETTYRKGDNSDLYLMLNNEYSYVLGDAMKHVCAWFDDSNKIYAKSKGKVILLQPINRYIVHLYNGRYIRFEPYIMERDDPRGVRMIVDDMWNIDIPIFKLFTISAYINNVSQNMREQGLLLINTTMLMAGYNRRVGNYTSKSNKYKNEMMKEPEIPIPESKNSIIGRRIGGKKDGIL